MAFYLLKIDDVSFQLSHDLHVPWRLIIFVCVCGDLMIGRDLHDAQNNNISKSNDKNEHLQLEDMFGPRPFFVRLSTCFS